MPYHTIPTLSPQTQSRDNRHSNHTPPNTGLDSVGWGYASKLFGATA